ncbi:MAG: hypothetical protein DMD37_00365 [Gemmatimonadetes bacterium]|nr:MAG: hypothetical protein DMD74_03880 [Gemmatimonadota bacterium]PYO86121.1 MAG: hypothetical protein DMD68_01360 [Gemmatimonadota bacterium]PYP65036.1 MAG: hypothetical protein DMD37_00365 [Gemmatimonadota bacterium]
MRTLNRFLSLAAALAIAGVSGLRAQSGVAIEAGVASAGGGSDLQLGIRADGVKSRGVGVEFSISTFPKALGEGVFLGISDLGPVGAIPLGEAAWLMPHAGVSGLVGVASMYAGGAVGFDVGLGVLVKPGDGTGVRFDFTYRRFTMDGASLGLTTVSVGFAF